MSSHEHLLAHAGHLLLYLLMLLVPLSGWAMSSAYGIPVVYLGILPLPDLMAANPLSAIAMDCSIGCGSNSNPQGANT